MPERKKILHVRNKFEGDLIKIWNLPSPKFSVDPIEIMEETIEDGADDGDMQEGDDTENPLDNIEEIQPEYDIQEQEPDEYVSSEELGAQLMPKPEL